jgi:dihydrofolate reductase
MMEGGTIFHFVTERIEAALALAKSAAVDRDITIGCGATTIRQRLRASAIDNMHLAV